jgi:hypothetical protein
LATTTKVRRTPAPVSRNGALVPPKKAVARPPTPRQQVTNALTNSGRVGDPKAEGFYGTDPFTIFCYGPSGVGKTSTFAFMPDVGYLYDPREEGIIDLYKFGQCPKPKWMAQSDSFEETMTYLANVANKEYDIRNLVLDSATGFELLCFRYHCNQQFDGDWSKEGFYSFYKGPKNAAKTDWVDFLDALDNVRRAGISVVLLGHSQVKALDNPTGDNYSQYIPYLDVETWAQTHRWAKAVLFYNIYVDIDKKGLKAKAKVGSEQRHLYTQPEAAYWAKNRWGMDALINAGGSPEEAYSAFLKEYLRAYRVHNR